MLYGTHPAKHPNARAACGEKGGDVAGEGVGLRQAALVSDLHAFLRGAAAHLEDGGQAWLVMSDLAEHLGLRSAGSLQNWFAAYGWRVSGSLKTAPQHPKARHEAAPLAFARRRETTTLYILERT